MRICYIICDMFYPLEYSLALQTIFFDFTISLVLQTIFNDSKFKNLSFIVLLSFYSSPPVFATFKNWRLWCKNFDQVCRIRSETRLRSKKISSAQTCKQRLNRQLIITTSWMEKNCYHLPYRIQVNSSRNQYLLQWDKNKRIKR